MDYVSAYQNKRLEKNQDGTWKNYKRATVEGLPFMGRTVMLDLLQTALQTPYWNKKHPFISDEARLSLRRNLCLRDCALIAIALLTGGRIREILMLTADNFDLSPNDPTTTLDFLDKREDFSHQRILVKGMTLLKRYTKEVVKTWSGKTAPDMDSFRKNHLTDEEKASGEYSFDFHYDKKRGKFVIEKTITRSIKRERNPFPIPMWERPLVDILLWRIDWAKKEADRIANATDVKSQAIYRDQRGNHAWLFPTTTLLKEKRVKDPPGVLLRMKDFEIKHRAWISNAQAYKIFRTIGENYGIKNVTHLKAEYLWSHFFRSQWASYLQILYNFSITQTNYFFSWEQSGNRKTMGEHYGNPEDAPIWDQFKMHKERAKTLADHAMKEVKWDRRLELMDIDFDSRA